MPVLERWEYDDPLTVAIAREQAAIKRERRQQKPQQRIQPCDGCVHIVRILDDRMCSMGKKRLIKCGIFAKGEVTA